MCGYFHEGKIRLVKFKEFKEKVEGEVGKKIRCLRIDNEESIYQKNSTSS